MIASLAIAAGGVLGGCRSASPVAPPPPPPDLATPPVPVTSALRCEECHERMYAEWKASVHATADRSPLYLAMRRAAPNERCEACHAPFVGRADPSDPGTREGVTCDACHGVAKVEARRAGAGFTIQTQDNVKYGPLCDAKDHYFHKMGCSPLHEAGLFCAGCHLWYRRTAAGMLPVLTEYEEWKASPQAEVGMECQHCHMRAARAPVAAGSEERGAVHDHGFGWRRAALRKEALSLELGVSAAEGALLASVTLSNTGAAHRVPTGLPERRLVLRVSARGAADQELIAVERVYGRVLVDDQGREAPFYAATRVRSDDRLAPGERRQERIPLAAAGAVAVRAELFWRSAPPALRARLGVPNEPDLLLVERRVRLPVARKTRR